MTKDEEIATRQPAARVATARLSTVLRFWRGGEGGGRRAADRERHRGKPVSMRR